MPKGKTITVRVSLELYSQTRILANEYNTTVTELVAYLLPRMPRALKQARFPVGGPKARAISIPAAAPTQATQAASIAALETPPLTPPTPLAPLTPLTPPTSLAPLTMFGRGQG